MPPKDSASVVGTRPRSNAERVRMLSRAAASGEDTDALLNQVPVGADSADRHLIGCAAVAVGTAQRALVLARKRAGSRTVAGRPLIEMQSTGHRLARAAAQLAVARIGVLAAARDEDTGGAGHRAPAAAAAAAEAAFAASHALVQVYGAAGTSDEAPVAAFDACQRTAAAAGPPAELWLQAGRRRSIEPQREAPAKPRLAVVVGSGAATVREILRYGQPIAEIVLIFEAGDTSMAALRAALQDEIECAEYDPAGPGELLAVHGRAPIDAITTFAEDKIRLTAAVAALLGLPYHTEQVAHVLTDKAAQREALARGGLGIGYAVAGDPAHAADLVRELGVPCIVKPLTGSGSRNTYPVDTADATATLTPPEMYPAIVETRLETGKHPGSGLLADVVSVETVFTAGEPCHIGASDRFGLAEPFRETGMVFPSQLPASLLRQVYDLATYALRAAGVTTGATHTEVKLTPDGPRIIEINGRLGGDVGRLTDLSTGTHAVELVLRGACGLPVHAPQPQAVAGVAMLVPPVEATRLGSRVPAGALRAIDGVVAVDVHTRPGDAVDYRTGWWAHVACIWYRAANWTDLAAAHTAALKLADAELRWE